MAIEVNPDEDFHVVLNGNVTALSLNALDAAYQGDRIDEGTLIWQEGFGQWMRLDAVLAELENLEPAEDLPASQDPAPEQGSEGGSADEELYSVQVAEGEVKQMSLDLMSDLYRMDVITDDTLVWQTGFAEWIPLCVLLADPTAGAQRGGAPTSPGVTRQALVPAHTPTLDGVGISPLRSAPPPAQHLSHSRTLGGIGNVPTPSLPAAPPPTGSVTHTLPYPGGNRPQQGFSQPSSLRPASLPPSSSSRGYSASVHAAPAMSTAPVAISVPYEIPEPAPRPSAWYSRGLVAVAAVTMLFVANQNGLGTELTHQMVQGSTAEQTLPSLSRSTPYGLSLWLQDLTERYRLDHLSDTKTILAAEPEPDIADMPAAESDSSAGEHATAEADEPSDSPASGESTGAAAAFGARLDRKGAAVQGQKPVAKQRAPVYRPKTKSPPPSKDSRKGALPSTSDSYDPMNGAL